MQSIDLRGLEEFSKRINDLLDSVPEARRKLHEEIAAMAKREVDAHISASGVDDSNNRIKDWQENHVGSGGGYAAVRTSSEDTGANSPGAITNYLESGHRIRPPSGNAKRYKPNIKVPYVDGYHFYRNAHSRVEANAIKMADEFADDLVKQIEG